MYKDELKNAWYEAYQQYPHIKQVHAVRDFLSLPIFEQVKENRHYRYLVFQMETQIRSHEEYPCGFPVEVPGMVYGMWCKAWDLLLEDMLSKKIIQE